MAEIKVLNVATDVGEISYCKDVEDRYMALTEDFVQLILTKTGLSKMSVRACSMQNTITKDYAFLRENDGSYCVVANHIPFLKEHKTRFYDTNLVAAVLKAWAYDWKFWRD